MPSGRRSRERGRSARCGSPFCGNLTFPGKLEAGRPLLHGHHTVMHPRPRVHSVRRLYPNRHEGYNEWVPKRWAVGWVAVVAVVAVGVSGCAGLPEQGTAQGAEIAELWRIFLYAGMGVAVVVLGLIAWSVARYRARPGGSPRSFREHLPIEVTYTAIPVAIVLVLFGLTLGTSSIVDEVDPSPAATIEVDAFDWSWRFRYVAEDITITGTPERPPEMVVPTGTPVRINLRSEDVVHAFYVPEFLFKRDAIPGRTTTFDLTVDRPGVYAGHCAEFCGLLHARMRFTVRAVSPDAFADWIATGGA